MIKKTRRRPLAGSYGKPQAARRAARTSASAATSSPVDVAVHGTGATGFRPSSLVTHPTTAPREVFGLRKHVLSALMQLNPSFYMLLL